MTTNLGSLAFAAMFLTVPEASAPMPRCQSAHLPELTDAHLSCMFKPVVAVALVPDASAHSAPNRCPPPSNPGTAVIMTANLRSLAASGAVVYGSVSKPSGSAYCVGSFTNAEHLKYKVASSSTIIRKLACLADMLGFGGCGGTQSRYFGDSFDVTGGADGTYSMQARYNPSDPYASGYWANKRLRITLSNFRVTIDPSTFHYEPPAITRLPPIAYDWAYASNPSQKLSSIRVPLNPSHVDTYDHETNVRLFRGVKVGIKTEAEVPLFGSGKLSTKFVFNATGGWKNTRITSIVIGPAWSAWSYITQVPARSRKLITLMAHRCKSTVNYTASARVAFDVSFHGFLRWGGNARSDDPSNRPMVTLTFESDSMSDINAIRKQYDRSNHASSSRDWMNPYNYNHIGPVMDFFRRGITTSLSGSFTGVKGTSLFFTEGATQPL